MTTPRICPACGAELAANAAEGLCPACLLKQGMASATKVLPSKGPGPEVEPKETQTLSPALGTKLRYFGDYELLEEIARGGMGMVYKARQASLNRVVALKMILSGQLASEAEVKRFHVEAEAAANLQHPNIVAIHEVGMHEGRHYFTMDFVDGRNLALIAGGKPLAATRAVGYVKTIAEAIHFAHQRGTLHRDLKPQNVLIDSADRVRITDFGLAKQIDRESSLTMTGVAMGSPSYMPPEQARGQQDRVGPHSDVYAIGAILYELLTGRPPFSGNTPVATMMQALAQDPVPPRRLNNEVPVDLETICLKCLEKSAERRYPSARALAEELDRFLKNEPIQARPASTLRKAVNWSRRNPLALAALAALAIVGLVFAVVFLSEQNAFLRALQVNPALKRQPGDLTRAVREGWDAAGTLVMIVGFFIWLAFALRGRPAKLSEVFGDHAVRPPLGGPRWRTILTCAGLACVACAGVLLIKGIQAHVWENYPLFWGGIGSSVYLNAYFGIMLLSTAWTDHHRALIGAVSRELPADVSRTRHRFGRRLSRRQSEH